MERPLPSSELSRLVAAYRAALEGRCPLASPSDLGATARRAGAPPGFLPSLAASPRRHRRRRPAVRALRQPLGPTDRSLPGRGLSPGHGPERDRFRARLEAATTIARGRMSRALVVGNPRVDRQGLDGHAGPARSRGGGHRDRARSTPRPSCSREARPRRRPSCEGCATTRSSTSRVMRSPGATLPPRRASSLLPIPVVALPERSPFTSWVSRAQEARASWSSRLVAPPRDPSRASRAP